MYCEHEVIKNRPIIDLDKIRTEIRSSRIMPKFFFYKKGQNKMEYLTYCTSCRHHGPTPAHLMYESVIGKGDISEPACPHCEKTVTVKRYKLNRSYDTAAREMNEKLMYLHQENVGREVYFFAYKCEIDFGGDPGAEQIKMTVDTITYFNDGVALQFDRSNYPSGIDDEFIQKKSIREAGWRTMYNEFPMMNNEPGNVGTCIEHSCLEHIQLPTFKYLAIFVKKPCIEKLIKTGYGRWINGIIGCKREFKNVIDVKADDYWGLFRNLTKAEAKALKGSMLTTANGYVLLKRAGVTHRDIEFAIDCTNQILKTKLFYTIKRNDLPNPDKFLKYIERTSGKTKTHYCDMIHDYADYISEIEQLNLVDADYYPSNFTEAHSRLSERLREIERQKISSAGSIDKAQYRHIRRKYKSLRFSKDGYVVRPLDSKTEIVIEGEQQKICVAGAGYQKNHTADKKCIFVVRKKDNPRKSLATVELDMKTYSVLQCRGEQNETPRQEVLDFVEMWKGRLCDKKII